MKIFPLETQNKNQFDELLYLFQIWRSFDLAATFFSMCGIIFSTFDYEDNYPENRTYDDCKSTHLHTEGFREATLLTTGISLIFVSLRYYFKDRWITLLYKIQNKRMSGSIYINSESKRKREFAMEFIVLSLFPYPKLTASFNIPLRYNFETVKTCYTVAEVLYCLMISRFLLLFRAISNYSNFQDDRARLLCDHYKTKANFLFSFKCLLLSNPVSMISLVFCFLAFSASIAYRVFERPLDDLRQAYFEEPLTTLWYILENISTLGYGDLFPISYPGRAISVVSYVVGAGVFTLIIVKLQQTTSLRSNQAKVFKFVVKSRFAENVLKAFFFYLAVKKKYGFAHPQSLKMRSILIKEVNLFKKTKKKLVSYEQNNSTEVNFIKQQINSAVIKLRVCNSKLDAAIECLKLK